MEERDNERMLNDAASGGSKSSNSDGGVMDGARLPEQK